MLRAKHNIPSSTEVWGAVCKNIISDRFSTKTAISALHAEIALKRVEGLAFSALFL